MKLWGGRFSKATDHLVDDFHSSISFDQRLAEQDITGSIAHATMLGEQGIIPQADAERLVRYYWRDDIDGTAATERIDDKIKHRITMAIYRTQYNGACCEQLEESYLKGAVYALAETVNRCGPLLDEDYLQRAADRLELPLENLKKRLDAVMKEFFSE